MVWIQVEVVGDVDEVIRFLGHLGGATVRIPDGRQISAPQPAAGSPSPPSGGWTEQLAADFTASLDAAAGVRRSTCGGPALRAYTGVHFANGPT